MTADGFRGARDAYERRAWGDVCERLEPVEATEGLAPPDLRRLAVAQYLTGRVDQAMSSLERLHRALCDEDDLCGAARWAGWLALLHGQHGQHAQCSGWLARGDDLLRQHGAECAGQGLLLVPPALQALGAGDPGTAREHCRRITALGRRLDDPELLVLGRLGEGQALVAAGEVEDGIARLDHAMVAATTEEVLPILAGIAYCAVISTCRAIFDLRRAQEWTEVLRRWCDDQQSLRPFRGECLVHRSEIELLRGDWDAARDQVEEACRHFATIPYDPAVGAARYQLAEVLRLQGDLDGAEAAYTEAAAYGHRPQPGLALLRLAQGRTGDAATAIRRALDEAADDHARRAALLPAHVEISLAAGDVAAAERSATELVDVASRAGSTYLDGAAAHARGTVALLRGDTLQATEAGRTALQQWRRLETPYEAARSHVLLARAHRAVGDHDTAELEFTTARRALTTLGATTALAEVDELADQRGDAPGGLTPREVEVLRVVATGASNRAVAEQLVISDRTVARHLSNIFAKLDVGSRAAATAWAYEHGLV